MIIYFYLLIPLVFQSSDSSSIRGRNFKNDLVPLTSSRLEPSEKDNSLKIVSNEPFIIQMQMPKSQENKMFKNEKDKKKKRPMKKRVSKIKPLRKKLRTRRDLQKLKSEAVREKKSFQSVTPGQGNATNLQLENLTKNEASRVEILKALPSHPRKREYKRNKVEGHFKNDARNGTARTSTQSRNLQKNQILLSNQSSTNKMVYPNAPKSDRHPHKYTYQDLIADRKRLEQKINYIKSMLNINDSSTDDNVRIRRRSESDRTTNKIAKMFLTLSAVNGLHDKRKSKCTNSDDEDEHVQDVWEKERKSNPSRKNSSSNEERYKVKKWIEFMKNKRSSGKTCTCMENPYGEEGDVFPLEQKLSKDYLKKNIDTSEESGETYGDHYKWKRKFSREDPENQLKALAKNGKKKTEFPLNDLELYRSRAKEILRNAEEILDRIKDEEERRLTTPNILMNHLKELTARIQGDPRNNENDLIRKIQKTLGWSPLAKSQDGQDGNSGSTLVDNVKSYIVDPFEKAKALTDESSKKLSTYLLQNLGKLQESSEDQQSRDDDKTDNLQIYFGEIPRKEEEKPQPDSLAKEQPIDSLTKHKEEMQNWENTLSTILSGPEEAVKATLWNNNDQFKQKMKDIMQEQQKKLTDYAIKEDSDEANKEMEPVGEAKKIKEVKTDLPTSGDEVAAPKEEVSELEKQPTGEIKTTNTTDIYDPGFVEQKLTPEESFQGEKDEKDSENVQEKEKELEIVEEIIEGMDKKEQDNDDQYSGVGQQGKSAKSQPTGGDVKEPKLRLQNESEKEQRPEEVEETLKAEKPENMKGKEEEMEGKEKTSEKEEVLEEKHSSAEHGIKTEREETDVLSSPQATPEDYNDFLELENDEIPGEKETVKEVSGDHLNKYSDDDNEARAESDLLSELLDPSRSGKEIDNVKESFRTDEQEKEENPLMIETEERVQEPLENEDLKEKVVSDSDEPNEGENKDTVLEMTKSNEEKEEENRSEEPTVEQKSQTIDDPTAKESAGETLEAALNEENDSKNPEEEIEGITTVSNKPGNANDTPLRAVLKEEQHPDEEATDKGVKSPLDEQNSKTLIDEEDTTLRKSNPEDQKLGKANDEVEALENKNEETSAEEDTNLRAENPTEEVKSKDENSNNETIMKQLNLDDEVAMSSPKEQTDKNISNGPSFEKGEEEVVNSKDGIDEPTLKAIQSEEDENLERENGEESTLEESSPNENAKDSSRSWEEISDKEFPKNHNENKPVEDEEKPVLKLENPDEETDEKGETSSENVSSGQHQETLLNEANIDKNQSEETKDVADSNLRAEHAEEDGEVENMSKTLSNRSQEDRNEDTSLGQTNTDVQNSDHEESNEESPKVGSKNAIESNAKVDNEKISINALNPGERNEASSINTSDERLAATENNENQEIIGMESNESVRAAEDENQDTIDALNGETVRATAEEENQEIVDEENGETVRATAEKENQGTVDEENGETVRATAEEDNQETEDEENGETVRATAEEENQETEDEENGDTVRAAAEEENQEIVDEENGDTVRAAAEEENQEIVDEENGDTVRAAEKENQEAVDGENSETVRATAEEENEDALDGDNNETLRATAEENMKDKDGANSEGDTVARLVEQEESEEEADEYGEQTPLRANLDDPVSKEENVESSLRENDSENIEQKTDSETDLLENENTSNENLLRSVSSENQLKNSVDDETPLKSAKPIHTSGIEADAEISQEGSEETARSNNGSDNFENEENGVEVGKSVKYDEETENMDESHETVRSETPFGENLIAEDDRLREAESQEEKSNHESSFSDLLKMSGQGKKLKVPKSIGEIMKDLEEGKEKDDITSIRNLNPDKIDHIIYKIDEAEQQNLLGSQEVDCRKECACADEIDTRSRNMGRYEIVKDFLHWMKDLQLNQVL